MYIAVEVQVEVVKAERGKMDTTPAPCDLLSVQRWSGGDMRRGLGESKGRGMSRGESEGGFSDDDVVERDVDR